MGLLSPDSSNAKLSKNIEFSNIRSYIMYLVPADGSGLTDADGKAVNLCPAASPGCRKACLFSAGRGVMKPVIEGRLRKTKLFVENRPEFLRELNAELASLNRRSLKTGERIGVRLNGTSDIEWETLIDMESYSGIIFYDYTKLPMRFARPLPSNYHLTFSRSEVNDVVSKRLSDRGFNVAVVFRGKALPREWFGKEVIDGTKHDLRFLDPKGVVVGLLAKGKARKDDSGFAIELTEQQYQEVI